MLAAGNWLYHNPPFGREGFALFEDMIQGTAHKPHVTRALIPLAVRAISHVLPPTATDALKRPLRMVGLEPVFFPDNHPEINPVHYFVWVYLVIASLTLLGEGTRQFLATIYTGDSRLFLLGGALTVALWPLLACYTSYVYDPFTPTLVLWAFLAGMRRKWVAYYPLLLLAALNKETAIVVPLAVSYAISEGRSWRATAKRTLADVAIVAAVWGVLGKIVFRGNPGPVAEFHLLGHNLNYVILYLLLPQVALIAVLTVGLLLPDWRRKPRAAKALAFVAVPLVAAALCAGFLDELRQYSESLPGLVALAFPTLLSVIGVNVFAPQSGSG
ncbi:MAG: hypothetical protein ACHQQS_01100 [Thermoanaerobaculales bacterium]